MPFLRTFAPFVAGVAQMTRAKFTLYNVTGARAVGRSAWSRRATCSATCRGCRRTSSKIIWAMILIPGVVAIFGGWRASRAGALQADRQA